MSKTSRVSAFTLVELLVVIGIIALLISILLPVLGAARRASRSAGCLANLKNIAIAQGIYQSSHNGKMTADIAFMGDLHQTMYGYDNRGNLQGVNGANRFSRVIFCPAMSEYGANDFSQNSILSGQVDSYGWNSWFLFLRNAILPSMRLIKTSAYSNTSQIAVLGDIMGSDANGLASDNSLIDPFRGFTPATTTLTLMRPNFHGRHGGLGSVLWMDGHASLERPLPVPETAPINPGNSSAVCAPPAFYSKYKIGYLAPSGTDLSTMSAEFYFVFRKNAIASNKITLYNSTKDLWR